MTWRLLNADWNFWPAGLTADETWAHCAALGFAGVELGVYDYETWLRDGDPAGYGALERRYGLGGAAVLVSLPPERWPDGAFSSLTAADAAVAQSIAIGRRAAELGLDFVGIWPGGDVVAPDADARWRRLVESFGAVTDALATDGIRIAVEYKPGDLVADPSQMLRLSDEVGASNLGALLDTGHACWAGEDLADVVRTLDPNLIHIHLGDSPVGTEGDLPPGRHHDFGAFFAALAESSYRGGLGLDMYGSIDDGIVTADDASREALTHVRAAMPRKGQSA